jgi:enoyl-CoA hydratase/carnithine racemase
MQDFVTLEIADGVARMVLNAPERRNLLGEDSQYEAIELACRRLARDKSVRAVVLTGAGPAFCAGGDIKQMLARAEDPSIEALEERYAYKEGIHRIPLSLHELEIPTIAAVNGPAIGAGLDLACMCDIRIASEKAVFAESFVKLGIIPGDGGAWLLQRIVGFQKAAEMTFTGDPISADQALAAGLVLRVVPPDALMDEAMALARRIAANPVHVLRMAKRLMRESQTARIETILEMSAAFQALAHRAEDHRERIDAAVKALSRPKGGAK